MIEPARHPLRKSLARDSTVLGAERVPAMLVMLFAVALVTGGMQWWSTIAGVVFAVLGIGALRRIYQIHPRMTRVFVHFARYARYYPARRCMPPPRDLDDLPLSRLR